MEAGMNGKPRGNGTVEALREVIYANLNKYVKEAGATKGELASAAGVSVRAVNKWLSGESCVDVDHIKPVCDFLGVPMHAMLGEPTAYAEVGPYGRRLLDVLATLDERGSRKLVEYAEDIAASGLYSADR